MKRKEKLFFFLFLIEWIECWVGWAGWPPRSSARFLHKEKKTILFFNYGIMGYGLEASQANKQLNPYSSLLFIKQLMKDWLNWNVVGVELGKKTITNNPEFMKIKNYF